MREFDDVKGRDGLLLAARVLLVLLFLIFGWAKMLDFAGTAGFMAHLGLPLPPLSAVIVIFMEFFVAIAIVLGILTRPLVLLLALYTLGTALLGHHFWIMTGAEMHANKINFFKNISIIGGLLVLYAAGPGRYSWDAWWRGHRQRHFAGEARGQ
jgi:putative oxidoreductase